MTEVEQEYKNEIEEDLKQQIKGYLAKGDIENANKCIDALCKLYHEQTEHDKMCSDWNYKVAQTEQSQKQMEQNQKQFITQICVGLGSAGALGLTGYVLEKYGLRVSVEPFKVFMKGITDSIVKPFRH